MNQEIIDGLFDGKRNCTSANREPCGSDRQRGVPQAHRVNSPTGRGGHLSVSFIEMLEIKPQSHGMPGDTDACAFRERSQAECREHVSHERPSATARLSCA